MTNFICWLVLPLSILSLTTCSVSQKEEPRALLSASATLPPGIYSSEKKGLLVRMSPAMLEPNADNDVKFKLVDTEFEPILKEKSISVDTDYFMPKMVMEITPAVPTARNESEVQFTYEIAHGGLWNILLKVKRDGNIVDQFVIPLEIPEK